MPAEKVLTRYDHIYLKLFRAKFHDIIHKLDENDIIYDLSNDTPYNLSDAKRTISEIDQYVSQKNIMIRS